MTTPRAQPAGPVGGVTPAQRPITNTAAPARPTNSPAPASPNSNGQKPVATALPTAPRSERTEAPKRSKPQRRPPRLASLQLKRVDPWTVLKISLIVAIVMFFVWMIAVGVLYLSLGSMDVWTKINDTWKQLTNADAGGNASDLVTPQAIFTVTAVIGAINIVLFTALATIAAFVYNAAAGMSGGVEITLGERD